VTRRPKKHESRFAESRDRPATVDKNQTLITAVILPASVSHWLTLEIAEIGADRADVVLIMIALIGTHAFPVIFLFTRVLDLIA
jgi:hypothetical protein